MNSRRTILRNIALLGIGTVFSSSSDAQKRSDCQSYNGCEPGEERLPQNDALLLVWNTQRSQIREIETQFAVAEQKKQKEYVTPESRWWFDTDTRRWDVQRPFGPGTMDSTHSFTVTYFINGKEVGSWYVDTNKKVVTINDSAR